MLNDNAIIAQMCESVVNFPCIFHMKKFLFISYDERLFYEILLFFQNSFHKSCQSSSFIRSIIIQLISKSDDSYIKEMYIVHRKLR